MIKTIFFTDKPLTFSATPIDGYDLIIDSRADTVAEISRAKVVDFFEKYNSILFLCNTPDRAFANFCQEFNLHKAAGGVVVNPEGETLMIYRNMRWDLPKGHIEEGESLEQCAAREVEEETAVGDLTVGRLITETLHTYILHSEWILKSTHWFLMSSPKQPTAAQSEEGIEFVEWSSKSQVEENLRSTYPTIRSVFEKL